MKKLFLVCLFCVIASACFAQGRSVSLRKKIKEPYRTEQGVISVGTKIKLLLPMEGKEFAFVSALNNFNEPIIAAPIRMSGKVQEVLFFKEEDGTMYLFTKFFCAQVDMALRFKEIEIVKEPKN